MLPMTLDIYILDASVMGISCLLSVLTEVLIKVDVYTTQCVEFFAELY